MSASSALIAELEDTLANGSSEKRLATLRRVTDLFLNESCRLNDAQIAVFDDILVHLAHKIEIRARAELSSALAPIANAPIEIIKRLANDDEVTVAEPVLTQSARLTESDLVEIATSKGQGHLLAISGRSSLSATLTDVLVERGNQQVSRKLAGNSGARFSEWGLSSLAERAADDSELAEMLISRNDMPVPVLQQLVGRATDIVRSRLLTCIPPEKSDQVQQVLMGISSKIKYRAEEPRDFRMSDSVVKELNKNGKLNEETLLEFITAGKVEETLSTLALFCGAPVEVIARLTKNVGPEGLITACKAARLAWTTVSAILKMRFAGHMVSEQELGDAKRTFLALSQAAAQRTLRFMLLHANEMKTA